MVEKAGEKFKPRSILGFAPRSIVLLQLCLGMACDSSVQCGQNITFEALDGSEK